MPDGVHSLSLAVKDHNPHVAGEVVDEQQEVASSSACSRCHRATQVPMHELEPLLGLEARLLGKGEPPLLHQHVDITELLDMVKARQALYHPLGTEPLQGLEVKVPEALVPLPRLIVPMSSKAEGLCYLHVEDIESIGASGYLGKKAMMVIPNPHDSILDLHTQTTLIQLSQVDDRVPQCEDVVDTLDLHTGGIPKLDGASDIGVEHSEKLPSTGHVMGGADVEAPPVSLVVAGAIAEEGVCSRLIKVEESRCVVAINTPWPNGQACHSCGRRRLVQASGCRWRRQGCLRGCYPWHVLVPRLGCLRAPCAACRACGRPSREGTPPSSITLAGLPLFLSEM
jgi:hypothetical protein